MSLWGVVRDRVTALDRYINHSEIGGADSQTETVSGGIQTAGERDDSQTETTVAIACQGGGSHAAFTAGVLDRLLTELPDSHRVVAFSGASGGAVCATAAWYGLLADDEAPADVLESIWKDIAATSGWERWVNQLSLLKMRSRRSPGSPYETMASNVTRRLLENVLTEHVDFEAFSDLAAEADGDPALFVSAAEVLSGEPAIFRENEVTEDVVIASAAVPQLIEAVEIDDSYYWDGFLSQNPPLWQLVADGSVPAIDELWVVRLTPTAISTLPETEEAILDRTQQLIENHSLMQERRFIETANEWIADGTLASTTLTETTVRTIELYPEQTDKSRLDRRESFIGELYADGEAAAVNFLNEQNARRARPTR